jgi:hypothetical protein
MVVQEVHRFGLGKHPQRSLTAGSEPVYDRIPRAMMRCDYALSPCAAKKGETITVKGVPLLLSISVPLTVSGRRS